MLEKAKQVAEMMNATVIDMRFVKPLDESKILAISKTHEVIVTLEENVITGGAGSGVTEFLASIHYTGQVINLGLPDYFVEHGDPDAMLASCHLDVEGILEQLQTKIVHPAYTWNWETVEHEAEITP